MTHLIKIVKWLNPASASAIAEIAVVEEPRGGRRERIHHEARHCRHLPHGGRRRTAVAGEHE